MPEHSDSYPASGGARTAGKHAHPAVYGLLVLPFGVTYGYLQVAVPFLLEKRGLTMAEIGFVSATASLPHTFKLFWSPILDTGWRRRTWYLLSIALTAAALAATALIPPDPAARVGPLTLLTVFTLVLALAQAAVATSSSAVNALMVTTVPAEKKGAVSGWSMAGNVGGTGVGGALALWLAEHAASTVSALTLAAICCACAVPAFFLHEKAPERHALVRLLVLLVKDVWATLKSREGWTGLVICLAPVGTGAATNLFSALSKQYLFAPEGANGAAAASAGALACFVEHAGLADRATCVEVVNGVLGGIVGAVGCLVGGYLADRMNRRLAYVLAGGVTALSAVAMAAAGGSPAVFTWGTLGYQFANGIAFAAFAAFCLELVGEGAGVATKYAVFVGVSNLAISYATWLDGVGADWGAAHFADPAKGARWGMLGIDALATFVGIAVVGAMVLIVRRLPRKAELAGAA